MPSRRPGKFCPRKKKASKYQGLRDPERKEEGKRSMAERGAGNYFQFPFPMGIISNKIH